MVRSGILSGTLGALLLAGTATAQVIVQPPAADPVVVPPPVVDMPVVVPPPAVVSPAPNPNVIVISPGPAVQAPVAQTLVDTSVPLAAPFSPAPPNTVIDTTAGRRIVRAVDGWDVLFDENGTTRRSHALLTDGLTEQNSVMIRAAAERMWPLSVGTGQVAQAETSTAHTVSYRVLRTETIAVPAGQFFTYVVERRDHSPMDGSDAFRTMWYAPSVGAMVRAEESRTQPGVVEPTYEVVSMNLPYPVSNQGLATVARRPDTIENRSEYCRQRGTTVRLADGRTAVLDCSNFIQADRAGYDDWLMIR
jgi:hypothetical protein